MYCEPVALRIFQVGGDLLPALRLVGRQYTSIFGRIGGYTAEVGHVGHRVSLLSYECSKSLPGVLVVCRHLDTKGGLDGLELRAPICPFGGAVVAYGARLRRRGSSVESRHGRKGASEDNPFQHRVSRGVIGFV